MKTEDLYQNLNDSDAADVVVVVVAVMMMMMIAESYDPYRNGSLMKISMMMIE